ncbi:hypothetical protein [Helicobacter sp. 23-1045]
MLPKPIRYKLNASILAIGASSANLSSAKLDSATLSSTKSDSTNLNTTKSNSATPNPVTLDSAKNSAKSVIFLDSNYNLYELQDGEFIFNNKIFDFEAQHQFSKSCALSMNGYVALGEPHSPNCHILHLYNGTLSHIKTLSWHKADIYNIRFAKNGKYMVSGGEDGKVFIYGMPHFNIIAILPPRADYISNIHFGKSQNLVVYSSYDNVNCIFDMGTNTIIGEFETGAVAEDMTFFDDDSKIFFICANGESGIYNITQKSLALRKNYDAWLTRAGMTKDDNFAYIGARDGKLRYLDLAKNKSVFDIAMDYEGIASMRVIDAKLYIGFASGNLEIFDLNRFEGEFDSALNSQNLALAQQIASQNLPLKTLKKYIALKDKLWIDEFKKAQIILGENPTQEAFLGAFETLKIFFEDDDKKCAFDTLTQNLGAIKELNEALNAKDYKTCYEIVAQNPHLRESSYFERLENLYNDAFEGAKELLLSGNASDLQKAQEILKAWQSVALKKDAVNALLRNARKFKDAESLFKNKHFDEFFKLAESFSAIKSTINYKKALAFGEQILATINELEAKGANQKALDLLEVLAQFLPFKNSAVARKNDILLKVEFLDFYAKNEYQKIYANIQKYHALKGLGEFVALQNHLNNIFECALLNASNGECKAVYDDLKAYFEISYLQNKIEGIFNIAYLGEIERNLGAESRAKIAESRVDFKESRAKIAESRKDFAESRAKIAESTANSAESHAEINWFATLECYIASFGKSDELLKILPQDKLAICDKISAEKRQVAFLETILVYK